MQTAEMKEARVKLLMDGYPRKGFSIFSSYLGKERGVCITRLHPEYVREKYGLEGSRFHWLSGVKQEGTLSPKNISALVKQVRGELKGGRCKFFLDGVEYLLLWNDMDSIVASLREIERELERVEGCMIVSIDPLTFEERDLTLLKGAFPEMPVLSAGSPHTDAAEPADKDRIDAGLLVSRGSLATP
ncbi:MAG TPA: DUF835 domain-containing protein [Methanomassiliicoccales archaeon]|nr:DUF835 domain-containing protein [Methanomassiliicoccales archaeon]HRR66869.1 DUF835 domain-containing protein [Methanomassiliicoccales archaeon]